MPPLPPPATATATAVVAAAAAATTTTMRTCLCDRRQKAAEMPASQRKKLFLKTCFGYANDWYSTNYTAAQLQLRKGHCLKS